MPGRTHDKPPGVPVLPLDSCLQLIALADSLQYELACKLFGFVAVAKPLADSIAVMLACSSIKWLSYALAVCDSLPHETESKIPKLCQMLVKRQKLILFGQIRQSPCRMRAVVDNVSRAAFSLSNTRSFAYASGRIHFTAMFRYFEAAEVEFLRTVGITYDVGNSYNFPHVHVECDFLKVIRATTI